MTGHIASSSDIAHSDKCFEGIQTTSPRESRWHPTFVTTATKRTNDPLLGKSKIILKATYYRAVSRHGSISAH